MLLSSNILFSEVRPTFVESFLFFHLHFRSSNILLKSILLLNCESLNHVMHRFFILFNIQKGFFCSSVHRIFTYSRWLFVFSNIVDNCFYRYKEYFPAHRWSPDVCFLIFWVLMKVPILLFPFQQVQISFEVTPLITVGLFPFPFPTIFIKKSKHLLSAMSSSTLFLWKYFLFSLKRIKILLTSIKKSIL